MTNEGTRERWKADIRKLICECIDSLNDPEGSTIIDMVYWIESNKCSLMNKHFVSNWIRELENERIVFHYNIPMTQPKRYKLCIGY